MRSVKLLLTHFPFPFPFQTKADRIIALAILQFPLKVAIGELLPVLQPTLLFFLSLFLASTVLELPNEWTLPVLRDFLQRTERSNGGRHQRF